MSDIQHFFKPIAITNYKENQLGHFIAAYADGNDFPELKLSLIHIFGCSSLPVI